MAKHALLSASGAKRWLNCTPSAKAVENISDIISPYAEEGTKAHALGELKLELYLGRVSKKQYEQKMKSIVGDSIEPDMLEYIEDYANFVIEKFNSGKKNTKDSKLEIEVKVNFSQWVPEGFGTADALIITNDYIEIIDLKYGQGVPVSAKDNPQLKLYALGAINAYSILYDIKSVIMTIYQPRLDNISSYTETLDELLKWANEFVKPRAEMAFKGEGEFVAGEHCRFCKLNNICKQRAEENLKLAQYDFKSADILSNDEIAKILVKMEDLVLWTNSVKEYALKQALKGVKYKGFKLVEGKSNRKYTDEIAVAVVLEQLGYKEDTIYKSSLIGITELEKLLGKKQFKERIDKYITKPEGKPVLVVENDERQELNTIRQAQEDFKN